MFEGPDKRKKASIIPTSSGIAKLALKWAGKGALAAAKVGYNAVSDANTELKRQEAMDNIHIIMFGKKLKRGDLFPTTVRDPHTHLLNPDEEKKYNDAVSFLRKHNVVPGYIEAFDRNFVR